MAGKNKGVITKQSSDCRYKLVFIHNNIEIVGIRAEYLREEILGEGDLILNLTGKPAEVNYKGSCPSLYDELFNGINNENYQEIVLKVPDYSFLDDRYNINFWTKLLELAEKDNVRRILVCCGFGLGRTGTALASLYLATHNASAGQAYSFIRQHYYPDAIESNEQAKYLIHLAQSKLINQQIAL